MHNNSNVTDIARHVTPFPQQSELYFSVTERKLAMCDRHDTPTGVIVDGYKGLYRAHPVTQEPQLLRVVGETYEVVRNADLFPFIEAGMQQHLPAHVLRGVTVTEQQSYGGRDCYREYVFPNLKCHVEGDSKADVAFRLIIGNSYGAKAVQLIAGAIDFWCSNGMIIGVHEKHARKHTSGLTLHGLDQWVRNTVSHFTRHREKMQQWSATRVPVTIEDQLFEHLVKHNAVSQRNAMELQQAMHTERNQRAGRDTRPTLWHLNSALTHWATHGAIRDTGNDHAANTRIDRGRHVNTVMRHAEQFVKKAA